MTSISPQSCSPHPAPPGPAGWLARLASALVGAVREMDYAQRRAMANRLSYNAMDPDPGQAPETYQEFLLRTWGSSRHEPTARQRAAGRNVR